MVVEGVGHILAEILAMTKQRDLKGRREALSAFYIYTKTMLLNAVDTRVFPSSFHLMMSSGVHKFVC